MKKIVATFLLSWASFLYASEKSEECQLWFKLSVPVQKAVFNFSEEELIGSAPRIDTYKRYLSDIEKIIEEMVERQILVSSDFKIPHDEKYHYWKVIRDFLNVHSQGFDVPVDSATEYWSLVDDFLKRLSAEYGAFVAGELLGIGVEAYFEHDWVHDESKKGEYFDITIRLPENELKEFEKRFEALND